MKTERKDLIILLFFIAYAAGNLGLIAYGILALMMPSILLEGFTLHVYQFPDEATTAISYLGALFRLLGFLNVILGLFGLLLLQRYRIERQTWVLRLVTIFEALGNPHPRRSGRTGSTFPGGWRPFWVSSSGYLPSSRHWPASR